MSLLLVLAFQGLDKKSFWTVFGFLGWVFSSSGFGLSVFLGFGLVFLGLVFLVFLGFGWFSLGLVFRFS